MGPHEALEVVRAALRIVAWCCCRVGLLLVYSKCQHGNMMAQRSIYMKPNNIYVALQLLMLGVV
jgi:hypothetical protein